VKRERHEERGAPASPSAPEAEDMAAFISQLNVNPLILTGGIRTNSCNV
jgi:hypothetical protein